MKSTGHGGDGQTGERRGGGGFIYGLTILDPSRRSPGKSFPKKNKTPQKKFEKILNSCKLKLVCSYYSYKL
ncbi:MAG: hypothetical protein C4527_08085 [Candidatus Omnitrophota bacterium]|nr:MAG: hypothetical protein C4527_08085 [Candidatus Omnitrophota bacterium]